MPAMCPPLAHPTCWLLVASLQAHGPKGATKYIVHQRAVLKPRIVCGAAGNPRRPLSEVSKSGMLHKKEHLHPDCAQPICSDSTMRIWPAIDARRLAMELNNSLFCPIA